MSTLTQYSRAETVRILLIRDGNLCAFPGCGKVMDQSRPPTVDHWIPKAWGRENGWTEAQIESLDNKRLMHKECNAKKGHVLPNEDGTLPLKSSPARLPKTERPDLCETCFAGRILLMGEVCPDCESGPQPAAAPKAYQKTPKECSHSGFDHCWMCYLGFVERGSALQNLITGI